MLVNLKQSMDDIQHIMRDIVSNGDTFQFAKMIKEQQYDINNKDCVYTSLLHVAVEYNQIEKGKKIDNIYTEYGTANGQDM